MKNIIIFGSTGSIGIQALNIIRKFKNEFKIEALTCGTNINLLNKQIEEFKPKFICIKNKSDLEKVKFNGEIFYGEDGIKEIIKRIEVDISLVAIVGTAGIIPAYYSLFNSRILALANKESLVSAGEFIINQAIKNNVKIIPVDSEHSAIFQCITNEKFIRKVILTASGGPFFQKPRNEFKDISIDQALNHPTWKMGSKITIDSATLMNKGLEIIEAKWLFNLSPEDIDVIIHPQSIIHSMVEYSDGSIIAQLGNPNMEIPISYALFYPERAVLNESLNLYNLKLEFFEPDFKKFPSLSFAYKALVRGKGFPAAINKANEIAVNKFLKKEITFLEIFSLIEKMFDYKFPEKYSTIEDVFTINREVEKVLS